MSDGKKKVSFFFRSGVLRLDFSDKLREFLFSPLHKIASRITHTHTLTRAEREGGGMEPFVMCACVCVVVLLSPDGVFNVFSSSPMPTVSGLPTAPSKEPNPAQVGEQEEACRCQDCGHKGSEDEFIEELTHCRRTGHTEWAYFCANGCKQ